MNFFKNLSNISQGLSSAAANKVSAITNVRPRSGWNITARRRSGNMGPGGLIFMGLFTVLIIVMLIASLVRKR